MKRTANLVLLGVALLFAAAVVWRHYMPESAWSVFFYYVTEAALVGGIADWFAVTALFRHPLGLKIPHTALIPNNRQKVIGGVTKMVEETLLSEQMIQQRVNDWPLRETLIPLVDKLSFATLITNGWQTVMNHVGEARILAWCETKWYQLLPALKVKSIIHSFAQQPVTHQTIDTFIDTLLDEVTLIASGLETRATIANYLTQLKEEKTEMSWWKKLSARVLETTDTLNLDEVATTAQYQLLSLLRDCKNHDHPFRQALRPFIISTIEQLGDNEQWHKAVMQEVPVTKIIAHFLAHPEPLLMWFTQQLEQYWQQVKRNEPLQQAIETYVKTGLASMIRKEHHTIGRIAETTLNELSNERLNALIEDKVGDDLQYIRLNGSMIGATLGGLVFIFLHFIYNPLLY